MKMLLFKKIMMDFAKKKSMMDLGEDLFFKSSYSDTYQPS